jgi:UDP-N-acetylmuramate dehydrogenase
MAKFQKNIPLAHFSSYKIGGPSRYFFAAKTTEEIRGALAEAKRQKLKTFILGGGTNLLIPDEGFKGLVLRPEVAALSADGAEIEVGAGVAIANLLDFTVQRGLSGLEWAGGLPGTVGGAIRGNAGAFGGETKDSVRRVRSLSAKTLEERTWTNAECRFSYRSSIFKEKDGEEVILSAVFQLAKGEPKKIRVAIQEKIDYRNVRHPMEYPNIGSIFKNVPVDGVPERTVELAKAVIKNDPFPVIPAAYLLAEAGLKGVAYGGAMISPKHPNFIVNVLDARASDVKALMALAQAEVQKKFGVSLEPEVIEV